MAGTSKPAPTAAQVLEKRRPSPRIAQMRRTFYFLSRNVLALVGIGILVFFVFIALYGAFVDPESSTLLATYCGTYSGLGGQAPTPTVGCIPVCTYGIDTPPPHPGCYATDNLDASLVG